MLITNNRRIISPIPTNDLDNGIFHFLQKTDNRDKYYVNVSTVIEHPTDHWSGAEALTNYELTGLGKPENDWCSVVGSPNQSFSIHFVGFRVQMTHYTIKSRTASKYDMPKGWVIQGSNDRNVNISDWKEIDKVEGENSLLECGSIKTFTLNNNHDSFSSYRFVQHVKNDNERDVFTLSKIEVYGQIVYPSFFSCKLGKYSFNINIMVNFIIITK